MNSPLPGPAQQEEPLSQHGWDAEVSEPSPLVCSVCVASHPALLLALLRGIVVGSGAVLQFCRDRCRALLRFDFLSPSH